MESIKCKSPLDPSMGLVFSTYLPNCDEFVEAENNMAEMESIMPVIKPFCCVAFILY